MLSKHQTYATLPTSDLDRARSFCEGTLGFRPGLETPVGVHYHAGGTLFAVTLRSGKPSGAHTQLGFRVADVEDEVADLRRLGIFFEEYETPKTENGIARTPAGSAAWFTDPGGNLIGLLQME
jgi:catechol 2,3-dioxygenase-like lactoylglutathione lyase family enzyme